MMKSKGLLQTIYHEWCDKSGFKLENPDERVGQNCKGFLEIFIADEDQELYKKPFYQNNSLVVKCDEISAKYRNEGNTNFKNHHNLESIESYTNALKYSKPFSEAQALAFANRSATFADLGLYNEALRDITRALKTKSYPEKLKYKLLERKAKCLMVLNFTFQSKSCFKEALQALQSSDLDDVKKNFISENIRNSINNIVLVDDETLNSEKSFEFEKPSLKTKLPKVSVCNPNFPNLSDGIEILYSSEAGRHGMAIRDIEIGEVICVQYPSVSRLCFFRRGRNCSNCFETVMDWLPSPLTNNDVFCSEECLGEALNTFHKIESKLDFILNEENGLQYEWLLALRLVTLKPLIFFDDLSKSGKFECPKPTFGTSIDKKFIYDDQDFESYQNLVSHDDKFTMSEYHFFAFVASFFVKALLHVGFFDEKSASFCDHETFLGKILMQMILSGSLNTHDVLQYEAPLNTSWFYGTTRTIGHAMNPTLALINHSCDPNSVHYNIGKATVSVAIKKIKKGEEIVECYHGFFGSICIEERQKFLLSRFKFTCQCQACEGNWPIVNERDGFNIGSTLSDLNISSQRETMTAVQTILSAIDQQITVENYDRVLELYFTLEKHICCNLRSPHPLFAKISRDIYKCLWIKAGSKKRLPLCTMPSF